MTGKSRSYIRTYTTGIMTSIGILLSCTMLLSYLLINNKIGQGGVIFAIPIIHGLSAVIGMNIVAKGLKERVIQTCATMGSALILLLTIAGLLMEGEFENISGCIIAISCSCILSCVICNKKDRKTNKMKHRNR